MTSNTSAASIEAWLDQTILGDQRFGIAPAALSGTWIMGDRDFARFPGVDWRLPSA